MSKQKKYEHQQSIVYFMVSCGITAGIVFGLHVVADGDFFKFKMPKFNISLPSFSDVKKNSVSSVKTDNIEYADPWLTLEDVFKNKQSTILLIDMRSEEDYKKNSYRRSSHVYFPYGHSPQDEKEFVKKVKEIQKGKVIVLLPYSGMSTSGEEAYHVLNKAGMKNVRVMKIGWNEMFNLPHLWVPENQWEKFDVQAYINN